MYDYEQYKHEMRDFYFDIPHASGPGVDESGRSVENPEKSTEYGG